MGLGAYLPRVFRKNTTKQVTKTHGGFVGRSIMPNNIVINGTASWTDLSTDLYLLECYETNPVVQAIINIKAEAFANIKFSVRDLKTEEIIPLCDYEKDKGKLKDLLSQPNPLQSTYEWLRQYKINYEVFGNGYQYASTPIGFENNFNYTDINVINNLQSYCVSPVLTGKWLEATEKTEIISEYQFRNVNGRTIHLPTSKVFHMNNANIRLDKNFTKGVSDLVALAKPISNINGAYESRNVLIQKRGALGILTSEKKDEGLGSVALTPEEKKEVQDAFKDYGLLHDQYQQIISNQPLKWQKMSQSVKELMLFEEVEADAIAIATAKGVPELLVKYYIKGGTFENLNASEKRLYDSTIIPEAKDFLVGLNNFLKTEDLGIELLGDYNHVNVLQSDKKQEAETNNIKSQASERAFRSGAITYNDYLSSLGMENDSTIGEKRIWDLDEKQLNAIGINKTNNREDGKE